MKQIKLPIKMRNDMIEFIALTIPHINRMFADSCALSISDGYTDTKIIKTFEGLRYWLRIGELELEKKAYDRLADELADYMLLEELNKEIKRGKKNSSN